MLSERRADALLVWAPAKVNLFLEVLAKRPDGYHEIATLMVAVSLFDTLEFKEGSRGEVHLICDDPRLSTGPENLVCRAIQLLREKTGCRKGVAARLQKRIPMAAGLGGGSADAAAALLGLNTLWNLGLSPEELTNLGSELGSDVPFFLSGPAAWCTGRGEKVEAFGLGGVLWMALVCPPIGIATKDVYQRLTVPQHPKSGWDLRKAVAKGDVDGVGKRLLNRLQTPAERLCPRMAEYWARLKVFEPAGLLMSGSGSTLFALCRNRGEASWIAREIQRGPEEKQSLSVFVVRSCF